MDGLVNTLTKEQIVRELQHRSTQKYLTYLALQEIMLDNYEDCTFLKDYDYYITTKHKNIVTDLKRNATKAFRFLEGYDEGEKTIRQFHHFVKIFEGLHQSIDLGGSTFHECLQAIEAILERNAQAES
jgi:hypothetical protein